LIAVIKTLQEELGALNDAVVGGKIIGTDEGEAASNASSSLPADEATANDTLSIWHLQQQATIEQMRGAIPHGFGAFVGPENRQRLANAVARL
jgi:hypothetical protein